MNILYVVHAYYPSQGGVQQLVQALAERMAMVYGDRVTVFTTTAHRCELFIDPRQPALAPGIECINGVTVKRFSVVNRLTWLRLSLARVTHKLRLPGADWFRGLYFGPLVPGLRKAISRAEADIVVCSSFPMIHMYAALHGARRAGKPVVMIGTVHPADYWSYDLPRMYRAIRSANAYVALSTYERDHLVSRGVPAKHIRVIGAGIEPRLFEGEMVRQAAQALRQRYGWGVDPVAVLVGRQTWYKRADVILAAMPLVWQYIPAARLVLAGARTTYAAELHQLVATLPPEQRSRITFVEDFAEHDKAALYSACDMLVQPSERESFGIVFLEAWAAGKPVIGARTGAAGSVITPGEDGLLATYGDANDWAHGMIDLLSNPSRAAKMGREGLRKVHEHYTWDRILDAYRSLYLELQ